MDHSASDQRLEKSLGMRLGLCIAAAPDPTRV